MGGFRAVIYYLLAAAVIALDQWTKWLVVRYMQLGESIPMIDNVLYITSHRNRGAAWGMLQGQFWLFYLVTVIVVAGIIIYIRRLRPSERLAGIGLGLMLGGAIGNFIDRVFRKEVVDFIHTYIGTYSFPVFNIADSALTVGVILLFIHMFFFATPEKGNE
ncbi:signal peptidase II [Geobacillus thermodenitrificans]|uniref:Lipoprotein signal peptidase n=1 Tax=Geobacillus thermodenitrificans (strain NG80-2) TaxID=420246 RepID=LSPA_GEOTN|nr:signal peptidase II [Geobacillus thermodenitrificans]A4IM26.1 RecName: Full=Lipoprotein signal peptidase; AltName: Full=Prolipoprotein signal peptidase; AltName: Full=Signal peptidase II; Short=SPase II [Geobacillus thermodenitrificans NG80-2]ABO66380.1 Lipoprotein signal peptidase [Geobacillus thermodenitrificans NG80-2]ARA97228.1 signal peptidase II [Geobacillus thermodenitrificans]MEC5188504.1 signal peptidase II [Geobacillus thermodenitrificans]MED0663734.1 signal peptidase II [Geobacil